MLCRDLNLPKNGNIVHFFAMLQISLVNAVGNRNHPHVYCVKDSRLLAWLTLWPPIWR